MAKYIKKPFEVEAITYEELVEFGQKNTDNVIDGTPISFNYNGHIIRAYKDDAFIIRTLEGDMAMTQDDMLITGVNREIYPCKKEIFEKTYEKA